MGQMTYQLSGDQAVTLSLEAVHGDVTIESWDAPTLSIESDDTRMTIVPSATGFTVGSCRDDIVIRLPATASVQINHINGDLTVVGWLRGLQAKIVSGDVDAEEAQIEQLQLDHIGGDVTIASLGSGRVSAIGGDLSVKQSARALTIGAVGGDCLLGFGVGGIEMGTIGGDLTMPINLPTGGNVQAQVGGDATLLLPEVPDVLVSALVGGDIEVDGVAEVGDHAVELRYGEGSARLRLYVGGDLQVRGPIPPAAIGGLGAAIGQELSALGRKLGALGRELVAELRNAFTTNISQDRPDQREQHDPDAARARRVRFKINQREWVIEPERIERIREQARQAAAAGVSEALAAVEQALSHIQRSVPPVPPTPPVPPAPPVSPAPPATGPTIQLNRAQPDPEREQQRAAILQMVADGRISAAEGEMLLAALDDDQG